LPDSKNYKPVPVQAAKAIAESFDKSIVIVFSYDSVYGLIHTTTYGSDPQNKAWAAQGGEIATRALGGLTEAKTDFEDYRLSQATKLLTALKKAVAILGLPPEDDPNGEIQKIQKLANAAIAEAERFLA